MALTYEYYKEKLPKHSGRAYPIKKAEVEKAIVDGGVTELRDLSFIKQRDDPDLVIMTAILSGESHSGYWRKEEPYLFMYSVPSPLVGEIQELLSKKAMIKKVIKWLVTLESASTVVRDVTRKIVVCYENGNLFVKNEQGKRVELS